MHDQKKTKAELISELATLRQRLAALEAVPHGVVEIEPEGTIIYANPAYHNMLGYPDKALFGKSILERAPDDAQREALQQMFQKLMGSPHQPESFQVVWQKKNGEPIDLQVDWNYKRNLDGNATGFVCVLTDIGERKRAEEGLRQSEEFARAIADSLPVLIAVLDAELRYVFANRQLQEWFGVEPDTVIGVHVLEVVGEKAYQKLTPYFESALAGKETSFETEVSYATGGTRFVQTHYVPRFGSSGEVVGLYTLVNDITTSMYAQKELRASQHLLQTVFETFPHHVFVKDTAAKFVMVNRNLIKSVGWENGEWEGKTPLETPWLSEKSRRENLAEDRKVLKTGQALKIEKKIVVFEDGHREYRSKIKTPLFDADGKVTGLFGLVEDITARVEAEEEVRASRQRLADAIESIPDAFALFNAEDRLVLLNQRFRDFFPFHAETLAPGVRFEEMLREGVRRGAFADAVGREDEWLTERLRVHFDPSGPLEQELSDGRWLRTQERRTAEGGVVGLRTDITALKRAEAAVKESEEKFRDYAESSADWFWEMDADLRFTYFSPNAKQITGVAPEKLIGKTRKELLGEDYDHGLWGEHEKLLLARRPFRDFTYLWATEGQETRWIQTSGKPFFGQNGDFAGYRGTGRDVTPQVLAQATLRKSEQMMARAQEVAHFGNLHWDFVTGTQHWSDEVFRILGMQPQEKEPGERTFADSLHPEDKKRVLEAMAAAVATGSLVNLECRIVRPNGEVRTLQANAEVTHDKAGKPRQLVGTVQDITERVEAESGLRWNQRVLQTVFDTIPHALFVRDRASKYIMVNRALAERWELKPEDFQGHYVMDMPLGPPEQLRGFLARDQEVFATEQKVENLDFPVILPNGRISFSSNIQLPLRGLDGEIIGTVGIVEDVTKRKEYQEALRESEARIRTITDSLPVRISLIDSDYRFRFVNEEFRRWFGMAPEKIVGKHAQEIIGKKGFRKLRPEIDKALAGTKVVFENEVTYQNVEIRHVENHYIPHIGPQGEILGLFALTLDITDRKTAENALGESEKRLRLITNTVPVLIAYLDKDLTYRFVNHQYTVMLEMPQEQFIGKHIGEVLGQEALATVKPRLESALQGHRESFQWTLRLANGQEHILQSDYVPHFGEDGEVMGIYACVADHTENRNMEAQLRQSQKMEAIGQLAGGVAHDFNNILQVIMGNVELAMEEPGDITGNLKEVASAAEGASNLTRQLLAFGRRQVLQTSVLNLNDLISNLMKMVRRLIGETIELVVIPSAVQAVEADPGMMEQVLLNLSVNARDAMPGGGRLVIETHDCLLDEEFAREHPWAVPGRYVLLTVSDTGIGMTPEVREHIFDPFFTTKALGEGTGLGLSTVYGILNQHRGMVDVYSEPGHGTTFRVYLPVTEKTVVEAVKPLAAKVAGGTETILVAEDDAGVLELVKRLLQSRGYQVLSARDGEEAVKVFEQHREQIGLVIMDVVMPKLSGPPLFRKIRELDSHTPILLSTGYTANAIDSEFLTQNKLRMIQKPYAPTVLFTAVRTAIEEGGQHASLPLRSP